MKRLLIFSIILFALIPAQLCASAVKRYAFIVGANNGGNERVLLKYAVSDAATFRSVLKSIGGVADEDVFVLYNPDPRNFYSSLGRMTQKINSDKKKYRKTELFFYYSGHSDQNGILLGNDKISYTELKKNIKSLDVDVRIVILDSCSSGAFTRTKGGTMKPAFFVDNSYDMKGNAIMTSSSADEVSQESDAIRGSFFTHYVLTGMRGAADVNQDKKITLNEVYQFAYNSTLARTQKTTGGPQHPNYHIEMIGTGDVVLTDINRSSSKIVMHRDLEGRFFLRDSSNNIVAEFQKSYGEEFSIAVGSGRYVVVNNHYNSSVSEASINVKEGSAYNLKPSDFSGGSKEKTRWRGEEDEVFADKVKSKMQKLFGDDGDSGDYLLKSGNVRFSGMGGPMYYMLPFAESHASFMGGAGGVIINDSWVFGAGGFGLVNPTKASDYSESFQELEEQYLVLGYGGFFFNYYFNPKSIVTYSVGFMLGGGSCTVVSDLDQDPENFNNSSDFFAFYPFLNVNVNMTRFFRVGAGVGYNYFSKLNVDYIKEDEFNNITINVFAQFGWF
ncbi:MAG: caspase family protein [Spirochaetes bacterium]|nr:caspase family protein [Spirochaetota bacterium]MBN2771865.1 caspase family protein [Spirochaetota bacterium]